MKNINLHKFWLNSGQYMIISLEKHAQIGETLSDFPRASINTNNPSFPSQNIDRTRMTRIGEK